MLYVVTSDGLNNCAINIFEVLKTIKVENWLTKNLKPKEYISFKTDNLTNVKLGLNWLYSCEKSHRYTCQ